MQKRRNNRIFADIFKLSTYIYIIPMSYYYINAVKLIYMRWDKKKFLILCQKCNWDSLYLESNLNLEIQKQFLWHFFPSSRSDIVGKDSVHNGWTIDVHLLYNTEIIYLGVELNCFQVTQYVGKSITWHIHFFIFFHGQLLGHSTNVHNINI